jgi:tetratricopeptide (TPR) repeat protein
MKTNSNHLKQKVMKTILSILLFTITISGFSSKYEETMKSNIEKMYKITRASELETLSNQFERIAQAEKSEWLPGYYSAYCLVRSTFFDNMDADQKHKQLDKAQSIVDRLIKQADESEIFALQALLYQLRITDMSKGAKYSRKAAETIAKAEKLNPNNPRVYYLRGSNTFHTPKFFGGGADKAQPDLEKAANMFENYKPDNSLMPTWGNNHNLQLLSKCQ